MPFKGIDESSFKYVFEVRFLKYVFHLPSLLRLSKDRLAVVQSTARTLELYFRAVL